MHIELLSATATAPGASGAAGAAVTGDSLVIKNGQGPVRLLSAWFDSQATGFVSIVNPSGHDTTRGIRFRHAAGEIRQEIPMGLGLPLQPQETLAITIAGSATAGDVETLCMLLWYADLPGVQARLLKWSQVVKLMQTLTTVEATITSAAGPGYSGAELITAESDLLKANRDYAVLGMTTASDVAAVTLLGPDLGNVRIGVPGESAQHDVGCNFFGMLSRAFGDLPCVPVINSGNKNATYLGVITDENAGSIPVTLHLALLK